jgi:SAM-dependent methyltransferase
MIDSFLEHKEHFSRIYSTNEWGGSGSGSFPENTQEYRSFLTEFINQNNVKTVYDFGCGDWQFSKLIDWSNIHYIGVDCVLDLINKHKQNYQKENIEFLHINTPKDFYNYKGDLLILKDVLQHWRNKEITTFLDAIIENFKYVLITNSSQQTSDWQDEPDRSRPLSCKYFPLKQYQIERLITINNGAGEKEISLIASDIYQNIITGNRFKNLCDDYIDESKPYIDLTKKPKIIFLYTDWIDVFKQKVLPKIDYDFKLVTHNSDCKVHNKHIDILENKNLIKWFGMNCHIEHPKLQPIPIGIANEKWPHGNKDILAEIINTDIPKTNLCYSNFDITTNPSRRPGIYNTIKNKSFIDCENAKISYKEYLTKLKKYKYVISPPGNSIDCHRIWEALYLGVIPIVEKHTALKYYEDLPILVVDSFDNLTAESLDICYKTTAIKNKTKSTFTFYKKLICTSI